MKLLILASFALFLCSCISSGPTRNAQTLHPDFSDLDNIEMLLANEQDEQIQTSFERAPASLGERENVKVGMARRNVKMRLGRPVDVETAGNPKYGNERWIYEKSVPTLDGYYKEKKVIYFENGNVVGWEHQ